MKTKVINNINHSQKDGRSYQVERCVILPDGGENWYLVSVFPYKEHNEMSDEIEAKVWDKSKAYDDACKFALQLSDSKELVFKETVVQFKDGIQL